MLLNAPDQYRKIFTAVATDGIQLVFSNDLLKDNIEDNLVTGASVENAFVSGVGETLLELSSVL